MTDDRAPDPRALGYHDVDGDAHTETLVSTMDETAGWDAVRRLRSWERHHLALTSGERLADVGCGRAEASLALVPDLGPLGELICVDSSSAMLHAARQRHLASPCPTRFVQGDASALDLLDESVDVVRSERVLQWVRDPGEAVGEFVRVLRPGGRLSLIDTDWSTLHVDVGDPRVTAMIHEAFGQERNRASMVGGRLTSLATSAGCRVVARTNETQTWEAWDPDDSSAPDGCFSMTSLSDDLVETGHLDADRRLAFVEQVHSAARAGRFSMSLTMYAVISVRE